MKDNKIKIHEKRYEIEEEITQFKCDKEEELHKYCVSLGGHFWVPMFQRINTENGDCEIVRKCLACDARDLVVFEEK
jgi:hypothetical protein